jgi:hypothetical protein
MRAESFADDGMLPPANPLARTTGRGQFHPQASNSPALMSALHQWFGPFDPAPVVHRGFGVVRVPRRERRQNHGRHWRGGRISAAESLPGSCTETRATA